jgi:hypothetical protein
MLSLAVAAIAGATAIVLSTGHAQDAAAPVANATSQLGAGSDWPQYRGPNRDGTAPNSPKLLDAWPAEGPPLLWKSEWIPSLNCGGCGNPVVADGKVFLYANRRLPVGGGEKYKFITTELLSESGWNADLPEPLAKKIEEARVSSSRPAAQGKPPEFYGEQPPAESTLDAYLAKETALDKYIKDFTATLDSQDAQKYGAYIKRRFCMDPRAISHEAGSYTWDQLAKLSKLRDTGFESNYEFRVKFCETVGAIGYRGYAADHAKWFYRSVTYHDTAICLDAKTGKTIWEKDIAVDDDALKKLKGQSIYTTRGSMNSFGVCSTPTIANGKCYVSGANGLYCFSVKDGTLLWQGKSNVNGLPTHASPLVAGGVAYHQGSAFDAETGKALWSLAKDGWGVFSEGPSPFLWISGGRNYLIEANDKTWGCVDLETGKVLWTLERVPPTICCFPILSGDDFIAPIFEGNGCGRIQKYKLSPTGAKLLWTTYGGKGNVVGGNFAQWQNNLYCFIGPDYYTSPWVECLDLETGKSKWKGAVYTDCGASIAPPVIADGKMFNTFSRGNDHAVRESRTVEDKKSGVYGYAVEMVKVSPEGGYVRLGKFSPGVCNFSSPAVADGRLYVRLETCVACYDLRAK